LSSALPDRLMYTVSSSTVSAFVVVLRCSPAPTAVFVGRSSTPYVGVDAVGQTVAVVPIVKVVEEYR